MTDTSRDPGARAAAYLLTLLLAACNAPSTIEITPHAAATPTRTTPELLVAGCEALVDRTCTLRHAAALRLWVAVHRDTPLLLELEGVALPVAWIPAEDGLRAVLEPAPMAGELVVRDADAWRWSIDLRELDAPPTLAPLHDLVDAGAYADATAAITRILPTLAGQARAEALALRADLAFYTDAVAASDAAHADAFAAAAHAGLFARAAALATVPIHTAIELRWDPARAEAWLDRLATLAPRVIEARLHHTYYAGLLAEHRGDLRHALPRFAEYARLAGSLGLDRDRAAALIMLGDIAARIGDDAVAATAASELRALHLDPLNRAKALNSSAWFALEARARGRTAEDPEPAFAAALTIFREQAAPDLVAEVQINLALAALQSDDASAAQAALAGASPRSRRLARWHLFVAARIDALELRHHDALRRFEQLADTAATDDDRWLEWRAVVGAGEGLEALGHDDDALRRYRRAIALHADRVATLAIHSGPEHLAATGDLATQRAVALLLRLARPAEAACLARRARSQALANLAHTSRDSAALADHRRARAALEAAREAAWELPRRRREEVLADLRSQARVLDELLDATFAAAMLPAPSAHHACTDLRPPASGELLLLYYPLARGHAAFAITEHSTRGLVIDELPANADPTTRSARLLGPFTPEIAAASRLRLLVSGRLGQEPLHALPFATDGPADDRLVDHAAIVYSLDLPRPSAPNRRLRRALQLAPPSNLLAAATELERAAAALQARGVAVSAVHGDEPDLRARLGDTDLLHYVGHAHGGGWRGALDLGGERELTVADLLSAPAPPLAVLSGCETGLLDPAAHAGGMSLAHALLLAGADAVLATAGDVTDTIAAEMTPEILAGLADGLDPAEALRTVQRTGLRRSVEFGQFRVFVP